MRPRHPQSAPDRHNVHMDSPWLASVTPVAPPVAANPTLRFLLFAAVVTGSWSGLLSLAVYGIGRAAGVPFTVVTDLGTTQVPWVAPLLIPLAAAVIAALLVSLLRGRAHAGRITIVVGTIAALLSMAGPVLRSEDIPTGVLLAVMHIITWVLVVPQLARIVADSEPGMSVERVD
jgi:hypothetical protein